MREILIIIVLASVSLLANIIGVAIPFWLYGTVRGIKYYSGLWLDCNSLYGGTHCVSVNEGKYMNLVPPILELLGTVLLTAAIICFVFKDYIQESKFQKLSFKVPGILCVSSGVSMLLGVILYASSNAQVPGSEFGFHAGFGLCTLAGILAVMTGVLHLLTQTDSDSDK